MLRVANGDREQQCALRKLLRPFAKVGFVNLKRRFSVKFEQHVPFGPCDYALMSKSIPTSAGGVTDR